MSSFAHAGHLTARWHRFAPDCRQYARAAQNERYRNGFKAKLRVVLEQKEVSALKLPLKETVETNQLNEELYNRTKQ